MQSHLQNQAETKHYRLINCCCFINIINVTLINQFGIRVELRAVFKNAFRESALLAEHNNKLHDVN